MNRLNLVLIDLELDEQVPVFTLASSQLVLIQVDNDGESLNLAIHNRLSRLDLMVTLDRLLITHRLLLSLVPFNLFEVDSLDSKSLSLVAQLN